MSAKDDAVRSEPVANHFSQPEIVRERVEIKIKVGQWLYQSDFVSHSDQFQTAAQMMRRHITLFDFLPHGRATITVEINNPPERFPLSRRKNDDTVRHAFDNSACDATRRWSRLCFCSHR